MATVIQTLPNLVTTFDLLNLLLPRKVQELLLVSEIKCYISLGYEEDEKGIKAGLIYYESLVNL